MVILVKIAKLATLKDKPGRVRDAIHCSLPTKKRVLDHESATWVSKKEFSRGTIFSLKLF